MYLTLILSTSMVAGLETENWMGQLGVQNKMYTELKIPATHNSGTWALTDDYSVDTAADPSFGIMPMLGPVFQQYGLNPTLIKTVMKPWLTCQRRTIYGQLVDGIRHFDFRVCKQGTEYHVCHGFIGPNYKEIFNQIRYFLLSHPTEFVSLDFNHLYGVTPDFITMITNAFGNMIIPKGKTNVPLGTLSGRIFVFYEANQETFDRSNSINTFWANKQTFPELTTAVVNNQNTRTDLNKLYVSQFVLTVGLNDIVTGLVNGFPRGIDDLADDLYWRIPMIIETQFNKTLMNVVNTDWYSRHFVNVIIRANY